MKRICIGVHVHAEPERLWATLARLRGNTARPFDLLLLPDGPDRATRLALEGLRNVAQSGTDEPRGAPACFNRLIRESDGEYVILLESGSLVGPGWLERLLAALEADAKNGLAGPSTNRAWNVQNVVPRCRGSGRDIAATAAELGAEFGEFWRTLEPLHCLADFCYAVKREVVETIGAADEGYGLGPCWEMDYTIRAARAGFQAVWAQSAYVFRHPPTTRRRRDESQRLAANKRRYQDKFCGRLLRGERTTYSAHCGGDDCPHFAPAGLIRTCQPHPASSQAPEAAPADTAEGNEGTACAAPPNGAAAIQVAPAAPLVSCIMPTHNRRAYVGAAIGHFLDQDYPSRELIIVDDGSDPVGDLVPADRRIRYVHLDERLSTGEKRNRACSLASGDMICHWDDDDWHAPWRLAYQVRGLIEHDAEICGLDTVWFHDPVDDRTWKYRYSGASSRWLAGGTLCYRRRLWERHQFADIVVGEDNRFVRGADPARILALENDEFYVARVHSGNTSRKITSGSRWHRIPGAEIRRILGTAYDSFADPAGHVQRDGVASSKNIVLPAADLPLASCIMPTANRRQFIPLAIGLFQRQTYPNRELIVVDDGSDSVRDLIPDDPAIRYIRLTKSHSLGRKRNIACEAAAGDIVAHWDDDDWYGNNRLESQIAALRADDADVVALSMRYLLELDRMTFWQCEPAHHARLHYRDLCPGTIVFHRALWQRSSGYPNVACAEDVRFLMSLPTSVRLFRLPEERHFICVRHGQNTWRINLDWRRMPHAWKQIAPPPFLPGGDVDAYAALLERSGSGPAARLPHNGVGEDMPWQQ